jgi:hypothetical protein
MSDRMKPKLTPQERARKWLRPPRVFVTAYVALSLIVHFSLKAYVTVHLARDVRTTQPISAPEVVEEWSPVLKSISDIVEMGNLEMVVADSFKLAAQVSAGVAGAGLLRNYSTLDGLSRSKQARSIVVLKTSCDVSFYSPRRSA